MKFQPGEKSNKDHVPPARLFGSSIKQEFMLQLTTLPTHVTCNSSFKQDEEYFCLCFAGHIKSKTASSVFADIKAAAAEGHDSGLLKKIIGQFGKVQLADGSITFEYDGARVERLLWKLIRGLYFQHTTAVLPADRARVIVLQGPKEAPTSDEKFPWWVDIRNTQSLGRYGGVFDYKWLCMLTEDGTRGHGIAMLFWDGLLAFSLFRDPTCPCKHYKPSAHDAAPPAEA